MFIDDHWLLSLKALVPYVDKPLLSVSQIVHGGHTVVFSPKGSYIDLKAGGRYGAGRRIPMRKDGNVYMLKMWVPREQPTSFQGPVETKP